MKIHSLVYVILVFMTLGTGFAAAESVMWSENSPNLCIAGCRMRLESMYAQVEYKVSVVNANTGAVIPSGSTVQPGTRVTFRFAPLANTDVFWNGTGHGIDSPYGNFSPNASDPNDYKFVGKIGKKKNIKSYANFTVAPPQRTISGIPSNCSTEADGVSKTCTLTTPGTLSIAFNIAETYGKWYAYFPRLHGLPARAMDPAGDGVTDHRMAVRVPAIPYTLIVPATEIPGGDPSQPNLSVGAGAACTTGTPYSITMISNDPDGNTIRYLVDWNADGTVDQFVPGSGYVASGVPQTASRTFAIAGSKTVRVLAEDSTGRSSGWATFSFSCAQGTTVGLVGDDTGDGFDGDGPGSDGPISPDLSIRATPSLVRPGSTTQIHWTATGVVSCSVAGQNGDSWTGLASPVGGRTSSVIRGETRYTLTCLDSRGNAHTKSAKVSILPVFQEK